MIFQWRGYYYINGGKTLIYGRGKPPCRKRKASSHPFHRPSIFILSRWITKHHVLVSLKSSFINSSPCSCLEVITVGSVEQSIMNWSRCSVLLLNASRTSLWASTFSVFSHIEISFLLDLVYAVHLSKICSTVSLSWWHPSAWHIPEFPGLQCLTRLSVLYLPDRNRACCTALATSWGLLLAEV